MMFVVGDVVWLWWSDRRLARWGAAWGWRLASGGFVAVMLGTLVWWIVARWTGGSVPPMVLMALVMIWHLLVLPGALVVGGVIAVPVAVVKWVGRRRDGGEADGEDARSFGPPLEGEGVSRRAFLGASVAALPPILTLGATGVGSFQMNDFRVRELTVPLRHLPAALEGLTIAHVSDSHVGRFTRGRVLDRIVAATNELKADLVLFTGDLINDSNDDLPVAIDMIRKLRSPTGVYLCEGNHDLIDNGLYFEREVRRAGLNLLLNETATVNLWGQDIQLIGLVWGPPRTGSPGRVGGGDEALAASLASMRPRLDPKAFGILLAHHPHALDYAAELGIPLTLGGHTHGGQLMLSETVGPGPLMYRYWSGVYRRNGCAGVISNGVGNWFPLRLNAPAEILHLTLVRAQG